MVNPCFKKLGGDQELIKGKVYEIPEGATHVGVWNGRVNFFKSDFQGCYRGQRSKWRFFPLGSTDHDRRVGISFPAYHFLSSSSCHLGNSGLKKFHGHNYGRPTIVLLSGNGNLEQKNEDPQPEEEEEEPVIGLS